MSKKDITNNNKAPKKKKNAYEKQKIGMKVVGFLMALIMVFGAIMSIVGMFISAS